MLCCAVLCCAIIAVRWLSASAPASAFSKPEIVKRDDETTRRRDGISSGDPKSQNGK